MLFLVPIQAKFVQINEPKVNNIIIHINNQINTLHTSQNIQINTTQNINNVEKNKSNFINKEKKHTGFFELNMENNEANFRYSNSVIEASQNKFFVKISRLFFSSSCDIFYLISIIISSLITALAFIDIFINMNFMNTIWLFIIEISIFGLIFLDTACRIYVFKPEYLTNIPLLVTDIFLLTLTVVQIIRYSINSYNDIAHLLHILFCACLVFRFVIVLIALRQSFKRQEDVRQNVEEIINFSEMMEENPKNFEPACDGKKFKKETPAISFVDDDAIKNKIGLKLNKEEKKQNNNVNDNKNNF